MFDPRLGVNLASPLLPSPLPLQQLSSPQREQRKDSQATNLLKVNGDMLTLMENNSKLTMAQRVAQAASAFHEQYTGHAPKTVTVVLSQNTLVIMLHEALSKAEKALAQNPNGATKIQEFHRQLFSTSSAALQEQIKEITGVKVREAAAEVEPRSGAVVHAFASGTMVQVFLLEKPIVLAMWNAPMNGVSG